MSSPVPYLSPSSRREMCRKMQKIDHAAVHSRYPPTTHHHRNGVLMSLLHPERGAPVAPLLGSLRSMTAADPLCLAEEVAFLGITAMQSHCIDERETLLEIVGRALGAMPERDAGGPERNAGDVDLRVRTWALETLVYPSVSMAAAGNGASARVLPLLEAALDDVYCRADFDRMGGTRAGPDGSAAAGSKATRYSSAIALGVRRLSTLDGGGEAIAMGCEGLRRRAVELQRANSDPAGAGSNAASATDLEPGLCLLAPLLLRPESQAHGAACAALVAVVRAVPAVGVRLLPFVLYVIRKISGAEADGGRVACLLRVLPELGAHKLASRPVAGVVQALAMAPQPAVRGLGIRLAAALIQINSRQVWFFLSTVQGARGAEARVCKTFAVWAS